MRLKFLLYFLLFISAPILSRGSDALTQFESANKDYRNGKYSTAAGKYETLLKEGGVSSAVYYNLGNAYYRMGKLGYAILNYERAQSLAPSDEDIRHNLEVSRARITDKEDILPQFFLFAWWESLQSLFSLDGWTITTFTLYIILLVSVGAIYLFRNVGVRRYSFYFSLLFAFLTLFSAVNLISKLNMTSTEKYGVVLTPSLSVRSAPEEQGTESFIIHEGLKVKVEDSLEGWLRIKLKDGNSGWVKKNSLGII